MKNSSNCDYVDIKEMFWAQYYPVLKKKWNRDDANANWNYFFLYTPPPCIATVLATPYNAAVVFCNFSLHCFFCSYYFFAAAAFLHFQDLFFFRLLRCWANIWKMTELPGSNDLFNPAVLEKRVAKGPPHKRCVGH